MKKSRSRSTRYSNTDFDLKSASPFNSRQEELKKSCRLLHYTHGEDDNWHAIVESVHTGDSRSEDRNAAMMECSAFLFHGT